MIQSTKNHKYPQYRALSHSQKQTKISEATQSEQYRKPNPLGDHKFNDQDFIDFKGIENGTQIKFFTYRYKVNVEKVKGVIFLFHGLNSHLGRAAHIGWFFSKYGYETVGFDHRGFGRSEGRRGYMEDLNHHLDDCKRFIDLLIPRYEGFPKFVMGQSMGGMTAYYLTLKQNHAFNGAILVAPALMNQIGSFLISFSKIMNSIMPKRFSYPRPIISGRSERNPQISQANFNDPYYVKDRFCFSTLSTLTSTLSTSPQTFEDYKCPVIIIQGGLDKIINPQAAFDLYDKCQTPNNLKQLLFYEQMWHDILHQHQIFEIMEKVISWMKTVCENNKKGSKSSQQNSINQ